jgi:hypothetical protein
MGKLYSATETTLKERPTSILVHGAFGARKTTSALSLSKYYPTLPAQPPFAPVADLKDGLVIGWDKQPGLGLPKLGLSVPTLNLSEVSSPIILDALAELHVDVLERIKNGTEFIVHDTVSAFNNKVVVYCTNLFDRGKKANEFQQAGKDERGQDTAQQSLYRAVLAIWMQEFQFFTSLRMPDGRPVTNVFNAHSEVKGEIRASKNNAQGQLIAQENNQAKGIGDTPLLAAEITGKAWGEFHRQCPLIMYVELVNEGGKQVAKYYTKSGLKNALARDRSGLLADVEPADFRVIGGKFK